MKFNEKHDRYLNNLDGAYEELLEAREKEILEDEILRDEILEDEVLFQRLAQKYLDEPVNREGFLDWAIEECKRERTPAHSRAWEDDRTCSTLNEHTLSRMESDGRRGL